MENLSLGIWAVLVNILYHVIVGLFAKKEGTFSLKQKLPLLRLSFKMHGATYGDLIPLSFFLFLFIPYFKLTFPAFWRELFVALIITFAFYQSWWRSGVKSYIIISTRDLGESSFLEDIKWAGYAHAVYTIVMLTFVWEWVKIKVPESVTVGTCIALIFWIILAVIQPGYTEGGWPPKTKKDAAMPLIMGFALMAILCAVTWWKIYVQGPLQ